MRKIDPHKAIDFIIANGKKFAQAKANRVYLEEFRKSKKAMLMTECAAETIGAKESYAYSHPDYLAVLDGIKQAVEVEEELRWQMVAAQARVEVWRSEESTARAEGRSTQ